MLALDECLSGSRHRNKKAKTSAASYLKLGPALPALLTHYCALFGRVVLSKVHTAVGARCSMSLTMAPPLNGSGSIAAYGTQWFLLRTNANKERVALSQVSQVATEVLLPLIELNVRRWGKPVKSVGPLFPGYLFAMFDFERHYGTVRYSRGI